jgi:uncharacterized membrane protein
VADDAKKDGSMDEQLKALFDYTKFHIGLYSALVALLLTVIGRGVSLMTNLILGLALFSLLGAGIAGGVIGSNAYECASLEEFHGKVIGGFGWEWPAWRGLRWTKVEHICFWTAVVLAIFGVLLSKFASCSCTPITDYVSSSLPYC